MSVNKVILIGNLGKDPELRFTSNGSAVAKFPIATSEVWNDRDGNKQERTEWHNIIVWGKQGESCGQYLAKGRQVFVEGSINERSELSGTFKRSQGDDAVMRHPLVAHYGCPPSAMAARGWRQRWSPRAEAMTCTPELVGSRRLMTISHFERCHFLEPSSLRNYVSILPVQESTNIFLYLVQKSFARFPRTPGGVGRNP